MPGDPAQDPRIRPVARHMDTTNDMGTFVTLSPSMAARIWMPDVFIDQAKAVRTPKYHTKPASLRVYNDSTVRYSSRFNFDVACNMDFHRYQAPGAALHPLQVPRGRAVLPGQV